MFAKTCSLDRRAIAASFGFERGSACVVWQQMRAKNKSNSAQVIVTLVRRYLNAKRKVQVSVCVAGAQRISSLDEAGDKQPLSSEMRCMSEVGRPCDNGRVGIEEPSEKCQAPIQSCGRRGLLFCQRSFLQVANVTETTSLQQNMETSSQAVVLDEDCRGHDSVIEAEILWTMKVVSSHYSYRSSCWIENVPVLETALATWEHLKQAELEIASLENEIHTKTVLLS
ncbi:hypothetical protein MRX96_015465 [Rhipicephalus microplus]